MVYALGPIAAAGGFASAAGYMAYCYAACEDTPPPENQITDSKI